MFPDSHVQNFSHLTAGKEKSVAERTSLPHLRDQGLPMQTAVQLRPRKHGQRALGSLSNGEKQRVKAELLCKGQNRAAHKVVPAWSGRQEDS